MAYQIGLHCPAASILQFLIGAMAIDLKLGRMISAGFFI
jgi:hypothetical protein